MEISQNHGILMIIQPKLTFITLHTYVAQCILFSHPNLDWKGGGGEEATLKCGYILRIFKNIYNRCHLDFFFFSYLNYCQIASEYTRTFQMLRLK